MFLELVNGGRVGNSVEMGVGGKGGGAADVEDALRVLLEAQ